MFTKKFIPTNKEGKTIPVNNAVKNRNKGRKNEFWMRIIISILLKLDPSLIVLRSKSANGCDIWSVGKAVKAFPFCVEAKAVYRLNIFKAFNQASTNTTEGMLPLVLAKAKETGGNTDGHLAILRIVDLFTILSILNKYCPDWYKEFKKLRPVLSKLILPFSKAKESFTSHDLHKVWKNNGESSK